ncbi:MAG: hypothetical protein F2793_05815 [Actinobacteria bacterium]|uniref:Unannotated protein n=1 Tax=freshwater metagenome TaxID=449393 RepID=A0A6J7E8Y4_9ZZZZ|nr:hypothetical protein [Actinomycetota bacterium]
MSRLFWIAVGAVVGIVLYRRGSRVVLDARERGVVLAMQDLATSASATVASARALLGQPSASNGEVA